MSAYLFSAVIATDFFVSRLPYDSKLFWTSRFSTVVGKPGYDKGICGSLV